MEFWLLVIGGALIIGIIGFAVASSNANKRHRRARERNTTITAPGDLFEALGGDEKGKPAKKSKSGGGTRRKEPVVGGSSEDAVSPQAGLGTNAGASDADAADTAQSSQVNNPSGEERATRSERAPRKKTHTAVEDAQHEAALLVVYVMARGQGEFRCSGVNRVLTRAACVLDDRGVFHLKDDDKRVVFSVVNALEPATFDPDRIDVDNTRGLVFFLETRGQGDKKRFESMLSTARKLALELDGELLDDKREPLSSVREHTYKVDLA